MAFSTLEKFPAELLHMVIASLDVADKMALKMTSKTLAKFVPESLPKMVASRQLSACMSDDLYTDLVLRESKELVSGILMNIEAQYRSWKRWTILLCSNCHHHKPRSNFPDIYRSNTAKIAKTDPSIETTANSRYGPRRKRFCLPCGTDIHLENFSGPPNMKVDRIDCVVCTCCSKAVPWYTNPSRPFPYRDWVWASEGSHGISPVRKEQKLCLDCALKLEAAKKVFDKTFRAIRKSAQEEAGN